MNLPAPVQDKRDEAAVFKHLLDQLPGYSPEWTPADGTIGASLMQIFARYMSILIGGLNRVPDRALLAFLDMMGMRLLPAQAARAYLLTREVFALEPTWAAIEALDNVVADQTQAELLMELGRRTVRATTWFLRSRRLAEPMAQTIERFSAAAHGLMRYLKAAPASARASNSAP